MDIVGQIINSLVSEHPPNAWTALIVLGVCLAHVATNWIKAKHHAEQREFLDRAKPEQLAALTDHEALPPVPPVPEPAASKLPTILLLLLLAGAVVRFGHQQTEARSRPTGRSCASDRDCARGESCVSKTCTKSARQPQIDAWLSPRCLDYAPDLREPGLPVYTSWRSSAREDRP